MYTLIPKLLYENELHKKNEAFLPIFFKRKMCTKIKWHRKKHSFQTYLTFSDNYNNHRRKKYKVWCFIHFSIQILNKSIQEVKICIRHFPKV